MGKHILVFGSFVVDLMSRSPHLPVPGETVKCTMFKMGPGGKGFNQGVAAHKSGGEVTMVTKIARDTFGDIAVNTMNELGMDTSHLLFSDQEGTGTALILVDENTSQNMIGVTSGACGTITAEDIAALEPLVAKSDYLLLQLEVNIDADEAIIDMAKRHGVQVILNTAPVAPITDEMLAKVDIVTPNEVEAEILTGIPVTDEAKALQAAEVFFAKGVKAVVITLGSRGVFVATRQAHRMISVPKVKVLDTTGAGDAFNGGFVTALSEGKDIWQAAKFANALASVAVQRMGTTPAMPTRAEIEAFIKAHQM